MHIRSSSISDIDRRSFLALAGGLAAASVVPSVFGASMMFPAGIQLYAVRDALAKDVPGTLKSLQQIGFKEVETAGFGNYTAKDYRRFCDDAGLAIPSAHLGFQNAPDLGALFADANTLGAQYATSSVLYDLFGPGNRLPTKPLDELPPMPPIGMESFKKIAAHMNTIGKQAIAAGLQYAYHNHNFEFEKMPDGSFGYDVLLRETDQETVKFETDCGWMVIAGADPLTYFKQYPGRFRMLHVKDFKANMITTQLIGPGRPQGVELGRGFIDYKPIFAAAKKAGVQRAFAEQEAPYVRPQLESAKVSYDYLASLAS